jgi:hypothetical protein
MPRISTTWVFIFIFFALIVRLCCSAFVTPLFIYLLAKPPNGLRYLRWGGDGEAVQPEKGSGVEKGLGLPQNPQR